MIQLSSKKDLFTKVFCIFMGNKAHYYDRKEIYAGGYPGAGARRGVCVRQQSERNARKRFARQHPELTFLVTRIGCGIAGFRDEEIAPLFKDAAGMANVILPQSFSRIIFQ